MRLRQFRALASPYKVDKCKSARAKLCCSLSVYFCCDGERRVFLFVCRKKCNDATASARRCSELAFSREKHRERAAPQAGGALFCDFEQASLFVGNNHTNHNFGPSISPSRIAVVLLRKNVTFSGTSLFGTPEIYEGVGRGKFERANAVLLAYFKGQTLHKAV